MNSSIKKLISSFEYYNIDAFLATKDVNVSYLVDFPSQESWLMVSRNKVFYITDGRYILDAQTSLPKNIEVVKYSKSFFHTVFELANHLKIQRLGFDDRHISLASFKKLKKSVKRKIKLISVVDSVESLRMIKTRKEVKKIDQAINLTLECYAYAKRFIRFNMTEEDILKKLDRYVKNHGAKFSFPPIIASGPNSCLPHARVTSRKVRRGEPIIIDMGIDINGYKSDLTRVFFLGKIPHQITDVYNFVRQAQQIAINKVRPGIEISKIDQEARNFLKKNDLDKLFNHSLGHGIGLEVHEAPAISLKNSSVLQEGMIFTIEPGVYFPGQFGIRVEDMILVTSSGCKILSN